MSRLELVNGSCVNQKIDINNATIDENKITFDINDVEQPKPSISMHIKINASKNELKEYYDKNNN